MQWLRNRVLAGNLQSRTLPTSGTSLARGGSLRRCRRTSIDAPGAIIGSRSLDRWVPPKRRCAPRASLPGSGCSRQWVSRSRDLGSTTPTTGSVPKTQLPPARRRNPVMRVRTARLRPPEAANDRDVEGPADAGPSHCARSCRRGRTREVYGDRGSVHAHPEALATGADNGLDEPDRPGLVVHRDRVRSRALSEVPHSAK